MKMKGSGFPRLNGRKGAVDLYPVIVSIMGIAIMVLIVVTLSFTYSGLENQNIRGLGARAFDLFETYQKADNSLFFIDEAAKMSAMNVVYELAFNGFHTSSSNSCGGSPTHPLWIKGDAVKVPGGSECAAVTQDCTPADVSNFKSYFSSRLNSYLRAYNANNDRYGNVDLQEGNYGFELLGVNGRLEVVGKATNALVVPPDKNIEYSVVPSFRESIDVDLLNDFAALKQATGSIAGKSRPEIDSQFADANSFGKLKWALDGYKENCALSCSIEDCTRDVKVTKNLKGCDPELNGDCTYEDVVEVAGTLQSQYCVTTADVSVRIPDARYAAYTGNKGFSVLNGGKPEFREYTYRFAVSWAHDVNSPVCT